MTAGGRAGRRPRRGPRRYWIWGTLPDRGWKLTPSITALRCYGVSLRLAAQSRLQQTMAQATNARGTTARVPIHRTCNRRHLPSHDMGSGQSANDAVPVALRRDGRRHSWVAGRSDLMSPGMGHVVTNVAGPSTQRARSRRSSWCSSSRRRIGGLSTRTRTGRAAVRRRRARAHRPAYGRPLEAYQTHRKSSQ
jgi:hypothetical protein